MGKGIEDPDGQIMPIRNAYLNATSNGKWMLATHYLEMLHNTMPSKARISDMPIYELGKTFEDVFHQETSAMWYCRKWMPLLESAIAVHREQMLRALNE